MSDELIESPFLQICHDATDPAFLLVNNFGYQRRYRFPVAKVGRHLGSGDQLWNDYLRTEALIAEPDEFDRFVQSLLRRDHHGFSDQTMRMGVIPTYACNLSCPGCFNKPVREGGIKRTIRTPAEAADKMMSVVDRWPVRTLHLIFTGGGEPLLAVDWIVGLLREVRGRLVVRGIALDAVMVTNGVLLTSENAARMMEAGIVRYSVTVNPDHARSRTFHDGTSSFEAVLTNLMALPAGVSLSLQSYFSPTQAVRFASLLDRLEPLRRRVSDFRPTIETPPISLKGDDSRPFSRAYSEKTALIFRDAVAELDRRGWTRRSAWMRIGCEAWKDSEKYVINAYGETTNCAGVDGMEDRRTEWENGLVVGEVDRSVVGDRSWKSFCYTDGKPCRFLPICRTGCRLIGVCQGTGWNTPNCEKPLLEVMNRYELLRWADTQRAASAPTSRADDTIGTAIDGKDESECRVL
jgi:sulfatase maturation enzyme AslB (radical SAM superfamily)